jgi:stearoyl-CoA desaturase (Delta-9 desaturase)
MALWFASFFESIRRCVGVPSASEFMSEHAASRSSLVSHIARWFGNNSLNHPKVAEEDREKIDWLRNVPYFVMHLACLSVIWVGWSPVAVLVAAGLYVIRMFAITGFYHRYFSHRTFRTSRFMQFVFAILGNSAAQRGPLWWAAHHREHHRHSDDEHDLHSPRHHGILWSHMGWFLSRGAFGTNIKVIPDLAKFPELRFLDRFDTFVPCVLAFLMYGLGAVLHWLVPSWGTTGWQMFVWGFLISTVACYHGTYTINSLCHVFGRRRFNTTDDSKNSLILALITLGEGWHNNHHYHPGSVRQGFYWWEIDITYYMLWTMSKLGIIWDLNNVPERVYAKAAMESAQQRHAAH